MSEIKLPEWLKDQEINIIPLTDVREYLDDDEFKPYKLFYKLLANNLELKNMWLTLKKRDTTEYSINFFDDVRDALTRNAFSYQTPKEFINNADEISLLSKKLANLLITKGFDTSIYYALNEDTRNNLTEIKQTNHHTPEQQLKDPKSLFRIHARDIRVSEFLMQLSEMAQNKTKEKMQVTVSNTKNADQVFFIRHLTKRMIERFNTPMRNVVAISASEIFDNPLIDVPYVAKYAP